MTSSTQRQRTARQAGRRSSESGRSSRAGQLELPGRRLAHPITHPPSHPPTHPPANLPPSPGGRQAKLLHHATAPAPAPAPEQQAPAAVHRDVGTGMGSSQQLAQQQQQRQAGQGQAGGGRGPPAPPPAGPWGDSEEALTNPAAASGRQAALASPPHATDSRHRQANGDEGAIGAGSGGGGDGGSWPGFPTPTRRPGAAANGGSGGAAASGLLATSPSSSSSGQLLSSWAKAGPSGGGRKVSLPAHDH